MSEHEREFSQKEAAAMYRLLEIIERNLIGSFKPDNVSNLTKPQMESHLREIFGGTIYLKTHIDANHLFGDEAGEGVVDE